MDRIPPLHPAVVHFPIALVTLSSVADLLGYVTDNSALRAVGWWSLAGAAIGAALAIPAGLFDMNHQQIAHDVHKRVHTHMKIGFALFAATASVAIWRWLIYTEIDESLTWTYLIAVFAVLALAFFQGWLGHRLVYSDAVGVASTKHSSAETETKDRTQKRERGAGHEH